MSSLITTPENLCNLVRHAETERDKKIDAISRREEIAMGAMAGDFQRGESPENLAFNVFSVIVPSLVTSDPVPNITTSGGYKEHIQSAAIEHAVKLICRSQRMHRALEPCAWDMFFKPFCGGIVETGSANMGDLTDDERRVAKGRLGNADQVNVGGEEDDGPAPRGTAASAPGLPPEWPRFKRLKANECGWDTRMGSYDERRFSFHSVIEDRDTLLDRAAENSGEGSWIASGIASCSTVQQMSGERPDMGFEEENQYIRYYVVYVPGGTIEGKDPGRNQPGTIHTIGSSRDQKGEIHGQEIREPYYWTGHPDGLHFFEGQYTTGKDSHFMTLFAASEDALEMLEAVSASMHQRIRDHKVVHAYDVMATEAMEQIRQEPHGGHVAVPGLSEGSGMIQTIETDALTPAEFNIYGLMQTNASRQLGIDQSGRGSASEDATATAVSVANNATRTKIEYLINRWNRFVAAALERMAFEVAMNDQVALRLDEDGRASVLRAQLQPLTQQGVLSMEGVEAVVQDQKMRPVLFQGGDFADESEGLDWYGMALEVRPHTMEGQYGDGQLAREAQWNQQLSFLLDMLVRQPHGRWIDRIRATGRAMGMSDAEMVVDIELAQQVAQMQLAQAAAQPVTSSSAPNVQAGGPATQLPGGGPMALTA